MTVTVRYSEAAMGIISPNQVNSDDYEISTEVKGCIYIMMIYY